MTNPIVPGMLNPESCAFFMCDIQQKFRPAMLYFDEIVEVSNKLVKASKILGIPLVVTEQYPQGLGRTVPELDVSHAVCVEAKTRFSMLTPAVERQTVGLHSVVLFGVEAHVCVEQTALQLLSRGVAVHVVADATTSRSQDDRVLAFARLSRLGCVVTTAEAVIFQLLGDKDHPKFADLRALIRTPSPPTGLGLAFKL